MTGRRHRISRLTVKLILVWAFSIMLPIGVAYGQSQVQSQDKSGVVDAEQPIDISADNLEVQQDKNLAIFSGNVVPEGSEPLAQAYAGHQFGGFSPQLGD
mgnify:CR=1 FL=1